LRSAQIALQKILHDLLVDLLLRLGLILVQTGDIRPFGEHFESEKFSTAVNPRVGLLFLFLQLHIEGHLHGREGAVDEVVDGVGGVGELDIIRAVANPS
jgi:hypothetical protein